MREVSNQFVVVRAGSRLVGVVTLADILPSLLPTSPHPASDHP
jgi:CBS domain-containing protein